MKIKLGFFVVLFCCVFSLLSADGKSAVLSSTKSEKPKRFCVYAVPVRKDFCCERGCPVSAGMVGQGVGTVAATSLVALVKGKNIVDVTKGFLDPHPLEGRDHGAEVFVLYAGLLSGVGALVLSQHFPVLLTKEKLEELSEQIKTSEFVKTEYCGCGCRIPRDEIKRVVQEL